MFFKVESKCPYFVEWKNTQTFSNHIPCSNHLILCSICKASIWTYNSQHHYAQRHPQIECPILVTDGDTENEIEMLFLFKKQLLNYYFYNVNK